jgi:hypothetical protein
MEDKIKRGQYWYYKAFCCECNGDRGYVRSSFVKDKTCRSCSAKKSIEKYGNPMSGKRHQNKEKFRKQTHPNVDYDSLKEIILPSGFEKKVYKQTCPQCNSDVGYRPIIDAKRTCRDCQHNNRRLYTPEQKRLRCSLKANLGSRLRSRSIDKETGTSEILPFKLEDLFSSLESKFQVGMTWQNYGKWELDHIIPDSWFKYESIEDADFIKCWSLDNLQPMWKPENASKSNRYSGDFNSLYNKNDKDTKEK